MLRVKKNKIENDFFSLIRIEKGEDFNRDELKNFDCGNDDLNDFFRNDAFSYNIQLLATTYYFQPREATEKDNYILWPLLVFSTTALT